MNDGKAKQQIVEKIKSSSNILITVSSNPSVDALSAALGLTLLLNKMDKHATAVFSGSVPPAITFLDPQKTFENTVNSLRDFIIALDKEKADHLRYKVEGDVVKIFITPYRTTISSDDLEFSQGDYNVELVLALGVKNQDNLDSALAAHGRILHDATVVTMNAGAEKSELGSIDWTDENASSLSELAVSLSEPLKKAEKSLIDEQIATAFLTGIVAATNRFSNNLTSSRTMTVAAQLMGQGANQQLIASELEQANEVSAPQPPSPVMPDGTKNLAEGEPTKLERAPEPKEEPAATKKDDGSLTISHEKRGTLEEVGEATARERQAAAAKAAEEELARQSGGQPKAPAVEPTSPAEKAEEELAGQLAGALPAAAKGSLSVADLQKDLAAASSDVDKAAEQPPTTVAEPPALSGAVSEGAWRGQESQAPIMGGTLNATTEQAAEDARRAVEEDRNKKILSHGGRYVSDELPAFQSPLNAAALPPKPEEKNVDLFSEPSETGKAGVVEPPAAPQQKPVMTLEEIDRQNRAVPYIEPAAPSQESHDEARAAVHEALQNIQEPAPQLPPASPQVQPASSPGGLPPMPPMPDFSTLPPMPSEPTASAPQSGGAEKLEDILPPAPAQQVQPNDPKQFKIPGQPG